MPTTPPPDRVLARLQRRQHGVVSRRQAVAHGLAGSTFDMRVRRGRYREVLPTVVADHGTPETWELRAMAALLWAGGDAVLCRDSAARVLGWGSAGAAVRAIHLLTRQRTRATPPGIELHRSRSFTPADVRRVGRLRVTAPPRTLVELAATHDHESVRRILAEALRRGDLRAPHVVGALRRMGPVAGAGVLRDLVAEVSPLHAACRSELESLYVELTDGTGLEPTAMNHPVRDVHGRRRLIDAVHLPERVPIELDGRVAHGSVLDRHDDEEREHAIRLGGSWRPFLRFTWDDVTRRGDEVLARVGAALQLARAPRGPGRTVCP